MEGGGWVVNVGEYYFLSHQLCHTEILVHKFTRDTKNIKTYPALHPHPSPINNKTSFETGDLAEFGFSKFGKFKINFFCFTTCEPVLEVFRISSEPFRTFSIKKRDKLKYFEEKMLYIRIRNVFVFYSSIV